MNQLSHPAGPSRPARILRLTALFTALALGVVVSPGPALESDGAVGSPQEEAPSTPDGAADDDSWDVRWDNGFKFDSPAGDFKLKIGGRVQADHTFVLSADDELEARVGKLADGSEFRRARLLVEGTVYERVEFRVLYDFAGGDADFRDVYLGFLDTPIGDIRVGHFKEPLSLEVLTSSKYIAFIERSLPIVFVPGRNMGVMAHGHRGDTLNWGVGAFRESDDFGTSLGDDLLNLTGRLVYRPIYRDSGRTLLHLGLAVTTKDTAGLSDEFRLRQRPEVHFGPRVVDTGAFATDREDILDLEIAGILGPLWFAAEYVDVDVDLPDGRTVPFDGYYLQAGYYLTGEHRRYKSSSGVFDRQEPKRYWGKKSSGIGAWEIAARLSHLDLSRVAAVGGEADGITLALNWYVNPVTRLMINWVSSDTELSGGADFLLFRAQIEF